MEQAIRLDGVVWLAKAAAGDRCFLELFDRMGWYRVGMDQIWYEGPVGTMVGSSEVDLGIWMGCGIALIG